ncbi:MAG TPA: LLM class F420-dependent oxidoreductase [Thermoanaerobaculia bacterium]|nr:LLM class F420-dependent oxidoreductase [Thermoanaerobaculia bacterium]
MDVGIYMFPTDYAIRVDELAVEAEQRGFESLWLPEHTHIPVSRKTPFPGGGDLPQEYSHTLDPFVGLAAAAVRTETIKLSTGICLLAQRDPIITAKEVASVDLLSNGRFVFGLGGGWNVEEMNHHGTEYDTRFQKLEERVAAMKAIWTREEAEFHGELVDFEPIWSWPKPVQKPHPPIFLGGATGYTRQRVVDFCDGWLPIGFSVGAVLQGIEDLHRRAEEAERDRSTLSVSVFGARPEREVLDAYENGGVDRAILMVKPEGRDQVLQRLDSYRELIG